LAHTADLTLATNNFEAPPQVLIPAMGLGSETTCAPSIGFVGERLFVGWCQVDSRVAKIERYELVAGHWQGTLIASDCLPAWSADATGEHVFYQSSDYAAYVAAQGVAMRIDSGVSGGFLLPDASAAFYTVGDQLRRTSLPDVNPIPIVTKGYSQPVDFSPNFGTVLYSTIVTYTDGTQRDLRLVPTDVFNPEPIALVADPVAALPRSSITQDGRYVMYLTAMTPSGGSLHVATIDGTERLVLPNVVEVVAASGSTLVFTDSSSDPNLYPVVMDLKTIDLATETEPRLIEAKILDGHSFQLDQTRENVIYVRSGLDSDASAAEGQGLFVRSIR
jgi:hypothetical protein